MSYIHEALIKAQKERNGHYPNDSVKIAGSVGITMKSSWLTVTLFFMLISIFVAIIIYSWFKTQQLNQVQINQYTKEKDHDQPEEKTGQENNKNQILTDVKTQPIVKKIKEVQQATPKQIEKIKKNINSEQSGIQQSVKAMTTSLSFENKREMNHKDLPEIPQKSNGSHTLSPDEFIKVTRLYKKGLEAQVQKKYDRAMVYYNKCLNISPHMAPTLNNMGVILLKQKQYSEAERYFLIAIKESPEYVDPYYNLACLFSQKKDTIQAIEYLKKAVRLSEDARQWAITDKDFEPLYELPEFNMIIAGYNL